MPITIFDPQYDRPQTKTVIDAFFGHPNVEKIFFNDTEIPGVIPLEGHDNHFHIKMKT